MKINKMQGAVNFKSNSHDTVSLTGALPNLPSPFFPNGQTLTLDVGGASVTFVLNNRGQSKTGSSTFALTLKPNKKSKSNPAPGFAGGNVTFKARLANGSWAAVWGINPNATGSTTGAMATTISLNGSVYSATTTLTYTAKARVGATFVKK